MGFDGSRKAQTGLDGAKRPPRGPRGRRRGVLSDNVLGREAAHDRSGARLAIAGGEASATASPRPSRTELAQAPAKSVNYPPFKL